MGPAFGRSAKGFRCGCRKALRILRRAAHRLASPDNTISFLRLCYCNVISARERGIVMLQAVYKGVTKQLEARLISEGVTIWVLMCSIRLYWSRQEALRACRDCERGCR